MEIFVTAGKGEGNTPLSAFDKALNDAGIANYNLIYLSSIIPPKAKVRLLKPHLQNKEYGNKLYIVMAKAIQVDFGKEAWAGVGWVQAGDGRGMFVEHTGENRNDVVRLIKKSLTDMKKYRKWRFGKIHYAVIGNECKNKPICVVVSAVYKSEGWK